MYNKEIYLSLVKDYRRKLHQIPEIGFDLYKTNEFVKGELLKMGYAVEEVAKTGLIAYKLGLSKEAIAFRSDMDALSVSEKTNVEFSSLHPGKMHACGHDGHMTILLAFAKLLQDVKELYRSVVLIFQPAEEGPGGALPIINEGIFEKYNIKKIFGLHLYPNIEEGLYGLKSGAMLAQNGEFDFEIHGTSAHGAMPHLGCDAVLTTSSLINSYYSIVSRNINPLHPSVLTIGTINGGEARNIIANKVSISGTIRTFDEEDYDYIKNRISEINKGLTHSYNVKITGEVKDYYKAVINDEDLVNSLLKNMNKNDYKLIDPMMISEDFSFYQRVVPGVFVMLGTKNDKLGYVHPLHSCYFNFDEKVLLKGLDLHILISKTFGLF